MFHFARAQCMYGNRMPKSLSFKINRKKLMQQHITSGYKTSKIIDVHKSSSTDPTEDSISCVKEIVIANDVLAVLLTNGIAKTYHMTTGKFLCEINPDNFNTVHTLVYNNLNDTLIIAYAAFPAHLQCKVVECLGLLKGKVVSYPPAKSFENVILSHPAFFEFCETNERIGSANLNHMVYTFWDMRNYKTVFEVHDDYQEIRVSDGLVAMFKQPENNIIPLALYDIQDGKKLVHSEIEILPDKEMQFLELLVSKLLIKQEGCNLRIYDLLRNTKQTVAHSKKFHPSAFVFYDHSSPLNGKVYMNQGNKKFFTVSKDIIQFWELNNIFLTRLHTIHVPGLKNPDLCSHSVVTELVCLYTSNGFLQKKSCSMDNEKEGDTNLIKQESNASLLSFSKYGKKRRSESLSSNCSNNNGSNSDNGDVDVDDDDESSSSSSSSESCSSRRIRKQNKRKFDKYYDNVESGALLLYGLNDGRFLNQLSEGVIGDSVEVIATNSTMSIIAIGTKYGTVRILRNNPKHDEYELKESTDDNTYDNLVCVKKIRVEKQE